MVIFRLPPPPRLPRVALVVGLVSGGCDLLRDADSSSCISSYRLFFLSFLVLSFLHPISTHSATATTMTLWRIYDTKPTPTGHICVKMA